MHIILFSNVKDLFLEPAVKIVFLEQSGAAAALLVLSIVKGV